MAVYISNQSNTEQLDQIHREVFISYIQLFVKKPSVSLL